MSLIVAARFTTFPAAEDAAQKLFDAGFVEEDVTLFFVNPRGQHAHVFRSAAIPHADAGARRRAERRGNRRHHRRGGGCGGRRRDICSVFDTASHLADRGRRRRIRRLDGRGDVARSRRRQERPSFAISSRNARFRCTGCRACVPRQSVRRRSRIARSRGPRDRAREWALAAGALGRLRSNQNARATQRIQREACLNEVKSSVWF